MRRVLALGLLAALGGCAAAAGPIAAAGVGSLVVFQRDPPGIVASAITGHDCNIVRVAEGKSYCKPIEPPPPTPPFCTRSLGVVDCWAYADPFGYYQRQVADGPSELTLRQDRARLAHWPSKLFSD